MTSSPTRLRGGTASGLVLVAVLAVVGVVLLVAASTRGAPGWLVDAYLVVAIVVTVTYVFLAYLPQRRLEQAQARIEGEARKLDLALTEALDHLQAGDLPRSIGQAGGLPSRLAVALSAATRALATLIQQIQNTSIEVATSGNTVHATASELAAGSSEQAAAVVEITATMEELARTAAQIAGNAASQANLAAQAEEAGNSGAAAVAEAVEGVEEVQKRISGIASRADTLGTRSKEIYRVLDLITEIAQETHILSLNAAIEAAAAGEHGRRFTVVADEVRRLAQRSQESVESVRALLDEFSGSIRATVVATEEGSKEASRVYERARSSATAIEELRGALGDTARAAREISMATQQQRGASDQVVLTLKEVSQVIQRMAEGLKQFTGTAERLNKLALSIQLLTQSFVLDSPRSLKHQGEVWAQRVADQFGHWEAVAGHLTEMLATAPFLEAAWVTDTRGALMAFEYSPEWAQALPREGAIGIGDSTMERPWFQAAMRERHTILTAIYDSKLTGERCFTVACPVRSGSGEIIGILGCDVNARSWTKL